MRALPRPIVALLTLALLAVAALLVDGLARGTAEDRVAELVQQSEGLPEPPQVTVHGFPFLSQALAGDFSHVEVASPAVPTGSGFSVVSVRADLHGVRVPVRAVLAGEVPDVVVHDAEVSALMPYPTAARVIEAQLAGRLSDVEVRPPGQGASGDGVLVLSGRYRGIRLQVPLQVRLAGSRLVVAPADAALEALPSALRQVAESLTVRVDLPRLPYGLVVSRLDTTSAGFVLGATGRDVTLQAR
jgi:hypothetical protein